jgi:hypothetical protein
VSAFVNAKNQIAAAGSRSAIEQGFLTASAVTDSEAITRDRDRKLQTLAADRFSNKITDTQYFDSRQVIQNVAGQQGTELNDRYAHDLLTAQQTAVIETTRVIKELENEQIQKFGSMAGGLFDAATSRNLPQFFKSEALGLGRTITENLAKEAWPSIKALIPHAQDGTFLGKALGGTFAPELKAAGLTLTGAGTIGEAEPPVAELSAQDPILFAQILDGVLLLLIHPASNGNE